MDLKKLKLPTKEELAEFRKKQNEEAYHSPNCMSNWLPLVHKLNIKIPKTVLIKIDLNTYENAMFDLFDYNKKNDKLSEIEELLIKGIHDLKFPFFMKAGDFSSKHDWKDSCFIKSKDQLLDHFLNIKYHSLLYGTKRNNFVAFRELIDTEKKYTAFNQLPITKERRYFYEEGKITGHHPYWPPNAVEGKWNTEDIDGANQWLKKINKESKKEVLYLKDLSLKVGKELSKLHPNWSIDWLCDKNGDWWLIDVAIKEMSFIWNDYKNITKYLD